MKNRIFVSIFIDNIKFMNRVAIDVNQGDDQDKIVEEFRKQVAAENNFPESAVKAIWNPINNNITVRLLNIAAVQENKTIMDLPVLFSGSMDACNKYCQMIAGYEFKSDKNNIHGGYYVNAENGDCLLLV